MFTWLSNAWSSFEAWCDSWMPKVKTAVVTGLGVVGSGAAVLQQYITGMPTTTWVTTNQIAIASLVLFTLTFWLHGLTDRVTANASVPQPAA